MKVARVHELDAVAPAVGHRHNVLAKSDSDALRLAEPSETPEVLIALQVKHLHRIVAESRHIKPLRCFVHRKMVDATLDVRKSDRANERQRLLAGCGLKHRTADCR